MSNLLLQPSYFASIAQYASIIQYDNIAFEVWDNFQKQTYRNRCYIYGANGKLLLNVPISHKKGGKQLTRDVKVTYAEHWHQLHFKSLQSAYRSSPYFEFYEDDLAPVFEKKHSFLKDLHNLTHEFVMDALQVKKPITFSKEYFRKSPQLTDLRQWINTKQHLDITFPKYVQMFDDKYGFIENLSILDILFMEGPNTVTYLENLELKDAIDH